MNTVRYVDAAGLRSIHPTQDQLRRYPYSVIMPKPSNARDPRKKWLYETWKNSRWMSLDIEDIGTDPKNSFQIRYFREYRFQTAHESTMFKLCWEGRDT